MVYINLDQNIDTHLVIMHFSTSNPGDFQCFIQFPQIIEMIYAI